eukprot:gene4654-5699_t
MGCSYLSVDVLSLVYLFVFPFGSIIVSLMMDAYGLRFTMRFGTALNALGALVRWAAVLVHSNDENRYLVLLLGQTLCAVAQPVFTNLSVRLATTWFQNHDLPTMLASLSATIGSAFGQVLPPILVSSSGSGLPWLLFIEAAMSVVYLPAVLCKFDDKPPLPPTLASANRPVEPVLLRRKSSVQRVRSNVWGLFREIEFVKLCGIFGLGLGIINTLLTMTSQIVGRSGYDNYEAGLLGATLLTSGLLSAVAVSIAMEFSKASQKPAALSMAYGKAIRAGYFLSGICLCAIALCLRPDNYFLLLAAFVGLGLSAIPMMPVTLEAAAEITYPCPEELSSGVLTTAGQVCITF